MNEKMSEKWTIVISVVIPMIGIGVAPGALIFSLHTATMDRLDRLEMTLGARIERVEQHLSARDLILPRSSTARRNAPLQSALAAPS